MPNTALGPSALPSGLAGLLLPLLLRWLDLRDADRLGRDRLANHHDAVRPARHGAFDEQQVVLRIDAQHLQVAHRYAIAAHVSRHAHALDDTRGERRSADRAGCTVEHRAVAHAAAAEVMPLDDALEALAAAGADHVDALAVSEHRHVDGVARLRRLTAGLDLQLAAHARRGHASLLEVPCGRLVLFRRLRLDETELHRFVAVVVDRLHLRDDARAGLEHGR